ncbi:MAG TPA: response regulator [Hyphomonadaceae bacterium]|nr:response regulator [Hyphomonadaceae bacterium]
MGSAPIPSGPDGRTGATVAASEGVSSIAQGGAIASPAAEWICVAAARNILVVDDNDRHLDILSTILSSVGHDVETCGSGAEAIRRLETRRFDVVVLDLIMPEVSGVVVASQMREGQVNRRTPIIACTANMGIARRQLADVPDVVAIIGKPIDTANLILAVARAPVRDRKSDRIRI